MTATGERPLIDVRSLVKHFPIPGRLVAQRPAGAVKAVDGVSFTVRGGETLGIAGETGCGKSTMARLLVALLEPTSGQILLDGRDIVTRKGLALKALRREVQMIFQDPYSSLNPRKPVGSIVAEPFAIHGLLRGEGERERRVRELIHRVGLGPEHYDRYPRELSGGQRQRIAVARAIALGPRLLIADEPVSALEQSIQAQVLNLLRDLQRELGLTLILIGRDLSAVRHICDRVAVMYLGKLVELAPTDALYGFPRHPYTGALLSAVPIPAWKGPAGERHERPLLAGEAPSPADPPGACRFHTRCPKSRERCSRVQPPLEDKGGGTLAACHYPLSEEEARRTLPAASASR